MVEKIVNRKRNNMLIKETEFDSGSHQITIENIRFENNGFKIIQEIIKHFINNKEIFFGFYRTDEVNISNSQFKKYQKAIKEFFATHGSLTVLNEYLVIAEMTMDNDAYDILPLLFDCYLETSIFLSLKNFDSFREYYSEYMKHRETDYITDGYADLLFSYFDSGDFSISFNSNKYDPKIIRKTIKKIINSFDTNK